MISKPKIKHVFLLFIIYFGLNNAILHAYSITSVTRTLNDNLIEDFCQPRCHDGTEISYKYVDYKNDLIRYKFEISGNVTDIQIYDIDDPNQINLIDTGGWETSEKRIWVSEYFSKSNQDSYFYHEIYIKYKDTTDTVKLEIDEINYDDPTVVYTVVGKNDITPFSILKSSCENGSKECTLDDNVINQLDNLKKNIVHLKIERMDNGKRVTYYCTGLLRKPNEVITAKHCIIPPDPDFVERDCKQTISHTKLNNQIADSSMPVSLEVRFQIKNVLKLKTQNQFGEVKYLAHNKCDLMKIVTTNALIDSELDIEIANKAELVKGAKLAILHYPCGELRLYGSAINCELTSTDETHITHSCDTTQGTSGAPIFLLADGKIKFAGIHTDGILRKGRIEKIKAYFKLNDYFDYSSLSACTNSITEKRLGSENNINLGLLLR